MPKTQTERSCDRKPPVSARRRAPKRREVPPQETAQPGAPVSAAAIDDADSTDSFVLHAWLPVMRKLPHAIRNPLGAILGSVELIELKAADEETRQCVGYVKGGVKRLQRISDGLAGFARLRRPELKPADLNAIVRRAAEQARAGDGDAGVEWNLELSDRVPIVAVDEEQLCEVLGIVFTNALEAMAPSVSGAPPERSHVRNMILGVRTQAAGAGQARLARIIISDTGPGIPEECAAQVFEPFFRHKKLVGAGLGLTLARAIIDAHQGAIVLASREGVGTTVTIELRAPAKESGHE